VHELAMNPDSFTGRSDEEILFVHAGARDDARLAAGTQNAAARIVSRPGVSGEDAGDLSFSETRSDALGRRTVSFPIQHTRPAGP